MSLLRSLRTIDSKFSWSFLGFFIGIIGIGYAIYVDQFKESKPELVFDILSNTQVLSVKENLNKLDIIYDDQNLKQKRENLILLTVRVSNEGNEDIRENDFYSKAPFGIKITNGEIAEQPTIIDASSDFLKKNLEIKNDSLNQVKINKVPFNKNQYFTIKILTICKEDKYPSIIPFGNISGINESFTVKNSFKEQNKEEKSFLNSLISGSLAIHISRFFFYLICIILFSFIVGLPASKISSYLESRKRKMIIEKFRTKTQIELTDKVDLIFDIYKEEGKVQINRLNGVLDNTKLLHSLIKKRESNSKKDYSDEYLYKGHAHSGRRPIHLQQKWLLNTIVFKLIDKNIITKESDKLNIDEEFRKALREFNYFLSVQ